ncbi:helix-turn-helix domain-containing protein [Paenibacillus polysaccharolyticus]|uniref:helix-turn-helix domain-containing protein n=1 Tax=Paenibacillus polysaccharolyticus TaxID=582692 RepID=UPI00300B7AFD
MINNSTSSRSQQSTAFHSCFFRLIDIVSLETNHHLEIPLNVSLSYRIIVVSEGSGKIHIDDRSYKLTTGSSYSIAPGSKPVIISAGEDQKPLHYLCMTFDIIGAEPGNDLLPRFNNRELMIEPIRRTISTMRKLITMKDAVSEEEQVAYHFRFQKLMYALLKQNKVVSETVTAMQAVEQSISFLMDHYHEEISTKQLAEQTGIGIKHYIRLFKKVTGSTPHEYVSSLRIGKAKELLLVSRKSLAEIAEQVGYRDSYYFNRRFKQITGVPPRVYVNTRQYKIMSMSYVCTLLALGVQPIGAPAYHLGYYAQQLADNITSIGDKSTFYYDKMHALKPDLIISCDMLDLEHQQQLERIAPLVTVPWMGLHATEHLQAIGDLLGMEKQAQNWINEYELKREYAQRRIKPHINTHETVGLMVIEGNELFVLGDRNVGEIMYGSFGLQPPPLVRNLLVEHPNQYGRQVTVEQLWQYEADRLFVIVYGAEAALTYNQLQRNPIWRQLTAVRQGKVQMIDPDKWIFYDVLSLSGQLDDGMNLLANG